MRVRSRLPAHNKLRGPVNAARTHLIDLPGTCSRGGRQAEGETERLVVVVRRHRQGRRRKEASLEPRDTRRRLPFSGS